MPSASSITQRAAKAAEGAAYHYDMAKNDLFYYENQIGDPSDEFIAQLKIIQNYYAEVMEAVDRAREAVRKGQINQAERYVEHAENTLYPLSFASADLLAILEDDDFSMILTGDREISPLRSNPVDRRQNGGPRKYNGVSREQRAALRQAEQEQRAAQKQAKQERRAPNAEAIRELVVFAANDRDFMPVLNTTIGYLSKKHYAGTLDSDQALSAMSNLAKKAAKVYVDRYSPGTPYLEMFSVATLQAAGAELLGIFLDEIQNVESEKKQARQTKKDAEYVLRKERWKAQKIADRAKRLSSGIGPVLPVGEMVVFYNTEEDSYTYLVGGDDYAADAYFGIPYPDYTLEQVQEHNENYQNGFVFTYDLTNVYSIKDLEERVEASHARRRSAIAALAADQR